MIGIALKMLFGDIVKMLGLVMGIAFSTLLMAQQGGFFIGLISRAANTVTEARGVSVLGDGSQDRTAEGPTAMRDVELYRVRGVAGVLQASPLVQATTTLRTPQGRSSAAAFLGVDDASLLGINPRFVVGSPEDLRGRMRLRSISSAFRASGPANRWPRARKSRSMTAAPPLSRLPRRCRDSTAPVIVYTRLSQALSYTPGGRNRLSYVLVEVEPGQSPAAVARAIANQTGSWR